MFLFVQLKFKVELRKNIFANVKQLQYYNSRKFHDMTAYDGRGQQTFKKIIQQFVY